MERRLFDIGVRPLKRQRALTLPVSIAIHAAVVAAALIVPILGDKTLPEVAAAPPSVFFASPVPVPVAPPPAMKAGPSRQAT